MPVTEIIAGEGAGVQRAALDVAIGLCIPTRSFCMEATASSKPLATVGKLSNRQIIERNVLGSDATLVLFDKLGISCSTRAMVTQQFAADHCRPTLVVNIGDYMDLHRAQMWLESFPASLVLNIAGPDSSEAPGIYEASYYFLEELLDSSKPISGIRGRS